MAVQTTAVRTSFLVGKTQIPLQPSSFWLLFVGANWQVT